MANLNRVGTALFRIANSFFDSYKSGPKRNKYQNCWMIRDVKRRQCVKEHAVERLRINSLRKNDILPVEIREIADKEIAAFPRDSSKVRLVNRCAVTSRPRGVVQRWRLSRIVWRHLADYNKLSGVQRAMW
ncbi:28S ribosomal protein S14, mitochondrial [Schistocerca serialis cubense]|uniref:28S ribosomal protein S14, mitochondrial n=1 Tax=Schistocerca nitens TaxID=7011 RepID=UPI002117DB34|nr:28S ribosomal protein S14, mitochondrial [Schistocerca nitens]XP_049854573.1 28S ribosomal protein S14, mitochondrial [Schistocerca gregaria]XP_049948390.1 28S ribosomal protein S14, mitochondrial [Schistocerca serialis cubense]